MNAVEIVSEFFHREANQDIREMGSLMSSEIVYEMPFGLQAGRIQGKEKLLQVLDQFIGKENGMYSVWEISNIRVYPVDPVSEETSAFFFVEMESKGIVKQSGFEYVQSYVSLVQVIDGQISLWREYFNPIPLQQALASIADYQ
ncbi:hypothetical protein EDM59_30170 [Brevibacillus nitrificans]|uniref:SnoaL-like domain-containing protein n=1 Tax=Brevibacillus nitrificans TaxID=651560 RepID=A0A3M8CRC9_9BACL|nr:nuclear transport factor 2 family protein [Brevibacillus nitrificans]RNB78099.1 hypothetical protein EDM59_30170 [Brevibacillus nitrificans]